MWYMTFDPNEPRFVGTPGPEIDQAWQSILYREYSRSKFPFGGQPRQNEVSETIRNAAINFN
jgi:hypothetical protein